MRNIAGGNLELSVKKKKVSMGRPFSLYSYSPGLCTPPAPFAWDTDNPFAILLSYYLFAYCWLWKGAAFGNGISRVEGIFELSFFPL
jgi:hypothetical protein